MNQGLSRGRLSSAPSRLGPCRNCLHTRASHGARGTRCYSTGCMCTGWLAPAGAA